MSLSRIKPSVRAMHAYHLKERSFQVKLNQNESPYDVPGWLKEEILQAFRELNWNRYPTFGNVPLVEKIADYVGVRAENVLVGNGSNELLQLLSVATLTRGKKILTVTPTFSIYKQVASVAEAEQIEIELDENWDFPVSQIIKTLQTGDIDLCILCSPNSPTGSILGESDLQEILSTAPDTLIVLDEAYHEFSDAKSIRLLSEFENLIITRTFSKAVGLAGLRIGYLLAAPELVVELNKAKLPYNLNTFSELAARKLLDHPEVISERVELGVAEKNRVLVELETVAGISVFPSAGNFILLRTEIPSQRVFDGLLAQGVLVRDVSGYHPRLKNTLRVSVGTPEENDRFLQALSNTGST